jgi:uncharacterized lipoprotein
MLRRRSLALVLAVLATVGLSACDWDPTVCVGKKPDIAVCV